MTGQNMSIQLSSPWLWGVPLFAVVGMLLLLVTGANEAMFLVVNAWPASTGNGLWANITVLGDTLVVLCLVLPFVGRRPDLVWAVMLAAIIATLMVHGVKEVVDSDRPPGVLPREQLHLIGYVSSAYAFPSGHSAAAFTLAGVLCLLHFPLGLKLSALGLAALVGLSRMAVGAHWPLDIMGGMLVGWLAAAAGIVLGGRLRWGTGRAAQCVFAVLLLVAAVYLLFWHDGGYPQARVLQVLIALVCLPLALPGVGRLLAHQEEKGR